MIDVVWILVTAISLNSQIIDVKKYEYPKHSQCQKARKELFDMNEFLTRGPDRFIYKAKCYAYPNTAPTQNTWTENIVKYWFSDD